jgi:hypothetical protein
VSATAAPALLELQREVDATWPGRSRLSDGILGDGAHQARASDHNTGDALDITYDPAAGPDLDELAALLFQDGRTRYVIWNKQIASRDIAGGAWRPYPGSNPHTRHLHVSIYPAQRDDVAPWPNNRAEGWAGQRGEEAVAAPQRLDQVPTGVPGLSRADEVALVRQGLLASWQSGEVDNVSWVQIPAGDYQIWVAAEPFSVRGLRLPASFGDDVEIASSGTVLPNTQAICDARYAAAPVKGVAITTNNPQGELYNDPDQVISFNQRMGPVGTTLVDGQWKEWIVEGPEQKLWQAVNYGMRRANGTVIQTPGHHHNSDRADQMSRYKGYSQLYAPTARKAFFQSAEIDLLDHMERGCPLGHFPAWLVAKLRGGGAVA